MELKFSCDCGLIQGKVEQAQLLRGCRIICMCDDCQAYANYLGRGQDILDANGGTDIVPVPPGCFKFTSKVDRLECLKLSEKGTFRWYAGCCRTPIANTGPATMPYVGLIVKVIDVTEPESVLGATAIRTMAKYGHPPLPKDSHQKTPLRLLVMIIRLIIRNRLKGVHKPHPFFDSETGEPIAQIKVVDRGLPSH